MILIDANLLVYAYSTRSIQHGAASEWLETQLNGLYRVGLPWGSLAAFLRLVTNKRLWPLPASMPQALEQVDRWLASDQVWIPEPASNHFSILKELLSLPGIQANDVPDAHLAALAIGHGLTLCSSDRGFARFPNLKWQDPLSR
jgi:toxin-antitoxin system PIN domain toxin